MSSKYRQLIDDLPHPERLKGSTHSGINGYPIVYKTKEYRTKRN